MSANINEKLKVMATPKRGVVGGRTMTIYLSDYDESSDSYNGFAVTTGKSLEVGSAGIEQRPVRGYRPTLAGQLPTDESQFVELGNVEGEERLREISRGQAEWKPAPEVDVEGGEPGVEVVEEKPTLEEFTDKQKNKDQRKADKDKSGGVSEAEADDYERKTGRRPEVTES